MNRQDRAMLQALAEEMKPALGVTEPMAVAFAAAKCREVIGGDVLGVKVTTNPALFKTGASVVLPGTDKTGFPLAAMLGILVGDASLGLEVLRNVDAASVEHAIAVLAEEDTVRMETKRDEAGLYVQVRITTDTATARVVVAERHDNVVLIEKDGLQLFRKETSGQARDHVDMTSLTFSDLVRFARTMPADVLRFVQEAIDMNRELAEEGLSGHYGMAAGAAMRQLVAAGVMADDVAADAQILVAAACDARLGGASKPAMSIAGSGSHGVTATLPLLAVARRFDKSDDELIRATTLSLLVTLYVKAFSGRLSALCGCAVGAGAGAAAGVALLLDGSDEQIGAAVKNLSADVTGIICDGGNYGCALKTATGACSALRSALLALDGHVIPDNSGIVSDSVDTTIKNMGAISSPGMVHTDEVILDIMSAAQAERPYEAKEQRYA
ncbi:serine dehydratase subunit alpha family protein [Chloroflexota bacterium]